MNKWQKKAPFWIKKNRFIFLAVFGSGVFLDIFFLESSFDILVIFLLFLWLMVITSWQLGPKFSFLGALVFLVVCPVFSLFDQTQIVQKASAWVWLFLLIGIIQKILQEKAKRDRE